MTTRSSHPTSRATPLLQIRDVADELGVSNVFIEREVARGALPHVRLGRLIRLRRADVDAYISEHRIAEGGRS